MAVKTYDPKNFVASMAGLRLEGFSEDSMVKITFTSPTFESVVGADGQVTRVRIHDSRATVAVSVMQSSDANRVLSTLLKRDKNSPNGAGIGTFVATDLNGGQLVHAQSAWVKGYPEQEFGKKVNARVWEIELADATVEDTAEEGQ